MVSPVFYTLRCSAGGDLKNSSVVAILNVIQSLTSKSASIITVASVEFSLASTSFDRAEFVRFKAEPYCRSASNFKGSDFVTRDNIAVPTEIMLAFMACWLGVPSETKRLGMVLTPQKAPGHVLYLVKKQTASSSVGEKDGRVTRGPLVICCINSCWGSTLKSKVSSSTNGSVSACGTLFGLDVRLVCLEVLGFERELPDLAF